MDPIGNNRMKEDRFSVSLTPNKFSGDRKTEEERDEGTHGTKRQKESTRTHFVGDEFIVARESESVDYWIPWKRERDEKCGETLFLLRPDLRGKEYINIFSLMARTGWFGYQSLILQKGNRYFSLQLLCLCEGHRLV
ncbi:hypothetical protein VNO78_05610 [Psophocarpus tetragonolobus]|uniref:Uncharacterized protein n=1 Tax=Psophocarpus tetragonolobus TaxID=3891 RepID=A0AAN9SS18_PSOTE